MSNSTVEQFAAESKMSVERMLEHLKKHGINKNSGSDMLTDADKAQLSAQTVGTIRINRTKVEKTTVDGVAVERRRSRKVVVPSADEQLTAAKAAQEKAAAEAEAAKVRAAAEQRKAQEAEKAATADLQTASPEPAEPKEEKTEQETGQKRPGEKSQNPTATGRSRQCRRSRAPCRRRTPRPSLPRTPGCAAERKTGAPRTPGTA